MAAESAKAENEAAQRLKNKTFSHNDKHEGIAKTLFKLPVSNRLGRLLARAGLPGLRVEDMIVSLSNSSRFGERFSNRTVSNLKSDSTSTAGPSPVSVLSQK